MESAQERPSFTRGGVTTTASGVYVVLGLALEDISSRPVTPLTSPVQLLDNGGNLYSPDNYATVLADGGEPFTLRTYNPNVPVTVPVVFDVPRALALSSLTLRLDWGVAPLSYIALAA